MKRFQILSLIGGGIRGAFITAFLNDLEQRLGKPIAESFDLIAGTSTGGIIAAGLALGKSAAEMHDFYVRYGSKIFTPRPKYKAKGAMKLVFPFANRVFQWKTGGGLDAAFRSRFCPFELQYAFDEGFGDLTLKHAETTRLIILSFNLTKGEPHVFRSRHLPKGLHDQDLKISDVVIAATAAPTYFPHKTIGGNAYIDGGVWATDPSMLAFAEAIRIQQFENSVSEDSKREESDREDFCLQPNNVHLLSIGTGQAQFSLSPPGPDAGLLYWASRVADVMGASQVQGIHLQLKFLLSDRYHHVNFKMEERWSLDDVTHIPDLFRMGEERSAQSFERLRPLFFEHHRQPFTPCLTSDDEVHLDEFGLQ